MGTLQVILTPLEILAIVALLLTVSAMITWAMTRRLEDKTILHHNLLSDRINFLSRRVYGLEEESVEQQVYGRRKYYLDSPDDVMDLWNAIIDAEKRQERK